MLGAVAGDIIGSVYEWDNAKRMDFPLFTVGSDFTDDSVLTFAVADCVLNGLEYAATLRKYARAYPDRGYGGMFRRWFLSDKPGPYHSFGNGSAMRASPIGFAYDTEARVLEEARKSAAVTHDHPEGIQGAQAVALAVFLARTTKDKETIRRCVVERFGYDLSRTIDSIRPSYRFDVTCRGSVPEAIIAFLESDDFEDAIRRAVSLGGDSDTIACMTGGIAQAYYGEVPPAIEREAVKRLPIEFLKLLADFNKEYL
ncbi:MAG: ADP-ribosylglycohydrolase family protein [Elusimicrobiota bacterium]